MVDLIEDMKGENILLLDLRGVSLIADFFVICSANSERQLKAIVQEIAEKTKYNHGVRPFHIDGEASHGWVLMDYSTVIVHAFLPEKRSYYDLEDFWSDASVVVNIQ
ncbi:MAG: ribosome silencing factor [Anaerolineae bacterium]|nr:ribosome silencing factor [Anaerolineae bacterium]